MEVYKGKTYSLTDAQIKGLANICYREQGGGEAGVRACVSHMLNYYEKYQTKSYANPYECTIRSGWYGSYEFNKPYLALNNTPQAVINYVRDVIKNGNRNIPLYVDEYDCLSDIKTAKNNGVSFNPEDRSQYKKDVTKIVNRYGSAYTFYCFPDGASGYTDAFGYINKPSNAQTATTTTTKKTTTTTKKATTTTKKTTSSQSVSSVIEKAISWMEALAKDDSHGYDQAYRWGERGDYDCSSAVITAFQNAGVPVKTKGAVYTGNMYNIFLQCGFKDVTKQCNVATGSGLQRGDVLLNHQKHTAMYCGNGKQVDCTGNEWGGATGGNPGDQTGKEIVIRDFQKNYNWNCVLRYTGGETVNATSSSSAQSSSTKYLYSGTFDGKNIKFTEEIEYGSFGTQVLFVQRALKAKGYKGANGKELELDGDAGKNTIYAIKCFQRDNGLTVDGIAGKNTYKKLFG